MKRITVGILHLFLVCSLLKNTNQLDGVQRKARKTIKRMKGLIYQLWLKNPNMSQKKGEEHDNSLQIFERCYDSWRETTFYLFSCLYILSNRFDLERKKLLFCTYI